MKILWIVNIVMPDMAKFLKLRESNLGGWLSGLANELKKNNDIELYICTVSNVIKTVISAQLDGVTYYVIPNSSSHLSKNSHLEPFWENINLEIQPDIVHIHGTEYAYGLAWIRACGSHNVCVSIQGLTSVYARYAKGALDNFQILKNLTFSDLKNRRSIFQLSTDYKKRGETEIQYFESINHVLGRTSWDRVHVWSINPKLCYHISNEILRPVFYSHKKWNFDSCERYSIFLSQAKNPIKGLHFMLQAMKLIIRDFPEAKLYVANAQGVFAKSFNSRLKQSGYYRLIENLIGELNLKNNIVLLPSLNASEMAERFTRSHVFVNASAIENSPNSLGEAQLLGVPCISSFVGGSPEFMNYGKAGAVYRFEEYEMLAYAVCKLFKNSFFQEEIDEGLSLANERHDPATIVSALKNTYEKILLLDINE
ncbi:glycosyltransferase [Sphingobacterium phlebotomi]|uniref:Glycosyltransferase n=1 Tax=Sphingobacterium phlebotomi TaxID=2605433 RepID=A0A5D4H826_9SPHI|nr:glycosyltransferase [Sphingobacterium phlebotomi]TYR36838.1 glycosyltransferase [Sphingobacterium phlebotomi]